MARRRNKKKQAETLVDIVEKKEQAQDFIDSNQNMIFGVLALGVLLVGGFFAYNQFYKAPKEKAAMEAISQAQYQFSRDSFALALTNPGNGYDGFINLIDNQGGTKSGNLAKLYAAISYLQLGQHQAAIDYLNDFSPEGEITPILKNGLLGDAYSELNDLSTALSYYNKAANNGNEMLGPYYLTKVGMLEYKQENYSASKTAFEKIKNKFPTSQAKAEAEKYIALLEAKM